MHRGGASRGAGYSSGAFSIEGAVRTLVAHEESGYEEWGASGAIRLSPSASGRGLSLTLAPSWGTTSSAGQLWSTPNAASLTPEHEVEAGQSIDAEVGYGFGLPRAPGVFTPFAALSLADEHRTMRAGTRWALGDEVSLELEGSRATGSAGEDDTGLMLRGRIHF